MNELLEAARKGRGKSERSLALIAEGKDILSVIHPASVRATCYQLFGRKVIESMAKSETNRVSVQLTYARESGLIPWDWIVDETREVEHQFSAWDDLAEYLDTVRTDYARDRWTRQPNRVEVWSEKGTVRGTLKPILQKYGVPFLPLHGFSSATALFDAVERSHSTKQFVIALYVGDWDPSGMRMSERDIPTRLDRYGGVIDFRRIALTKEHCRQLGTRPSFSVETKRRDSNYAWFKEHYGSRCWELDAMNPADLRAVVEQAIRECIDWDIWAQDDRVEAAELVSIEKVISTWPSISGPASK